MRKSKHNLPLKERFERFFDKGSLDQCWNWKGNPDKKGYGQFRIGRHNCKAHRVSYSLYVGEIPADSEEMRHTCDNPGCVNPEHLMPGTMIENQHDAWSRDRKRAVRKLSKRDVLEIMASDQPQKSLAARYGVCPPEISKIKNGKRGKGILMMTEVVSRSAGG